MLRPGEKVSNGPGTVIGTNVKLVGALRDSNDIVIHGLVEGEVASEKTVTVGESAHVKGPIVGATVSVAGEVKGSIEATVKLEILPTGKVYGNITARDLSIRSGAIFIGKSSMTEPEKSESAQGEPVKPIDESNYEVES